MKQEVVISKNLDTKQAVEELYSQLKYKEQPALVIFLASTRYDFELATKEIKKCFPNSIVVGTTTSGEITKQGFIENSIVLTTFICNRTKVKAALIKDAVHFPILEKEKISKAAKECGISCEDVNSHKNAFAMTFINGNHNIEEMVLSLFYAVIKNEQFQVVGGSAGDDLKFQETLVSLDGEITSTGAVIVFFKTPCAFKIVKENIYYPIGETLVLTDVDIEKRKIRKIDHGNPVDVLANKINVPKQVLGDKLLEYPLGRVIGDERYICSLKGIDENGMLDSYINVMPNTKLEILKSKNVDETVENTCKEIQEEIKNVQFVFFINCILRTLDLKNMQQCNTVIKTYEKYFPAFCGYSSYGEQFNQLCLNQTVVMVVMGE